MSRFAKATETVRLELDEDWVDLKQALSVGDRAATTRAGVRRMKITTIKRKQGTDEEEAEEGNIVEGFDLAASQMATLTRAIIAWGGPGFCQHDHSDGSRHDLNGGNGCAHLGVTEALIDSLDVTTADAIINKINELNPVASTEDTAHP